MSAVALVRSASVVAAATAVLAAYPSSIADQDRPSPSRAARSELWVDPGDIRRKDAFRGPGGRDLLPSRDGVYEVSEIDTTGYSGGYTVMDQVGRQWDVKIGPEAQPEVVLSRVLWLIGYHQPVVYFLPTWRKKGEEEREQVSGRFRLQSDHETDGEWAWRENPFVGTRELKGLVVVNLLLNNWDFKTSNNRVYTFERTTRGPSRWFVVQDLGASLGRSGWPMGNRNDIASFESQRFVWLEDGALTFDYRGRHREVLEDLAPADVLWACRLLNRITERQWTDIFKAAAYPTDTATRYRRHIALKIAEGLALDPQTQVRR